MNQQALSSFIWSVADLLRGDYKQSEYGKVILPFTVLRRLDCVLESTKAAVLAEFKAKTAAGLNPEPFLLRKAGQSFDNTSPLDLGKLLGDQDHNDQLVYVNGVLKGKQLENKTLVQQAANNTKEQFANSPDRSQAILHAIMDALDVHTAMSSQTLNSQRIQDGLKDTSLGPAQLYEALRARHLFRQ